MKVLTKNELFLDKFSLIREIKTGSIFIYPTDTIYGIGCNATLEEPVEKIRTIKKRPDQPFSIIAPNKTWIIKNCKVNNEAKKWIKKLPGPYTLILRLKNKDAVADNVNLGKDSLGVRIPDNWFSDIVNEVNVPIITTSVNKTGEEYMTSMDNLDKEIKNRIQFFFYDGEKPGKPSNIVYLDKEKPKIRKR